MERLKRIIGVVALALLVMPVMFTSVANGQQLKIGYTDPDVVIQAMPQYRQIMQQLQQEYKAKQDALQSLAADFQEKLDKYQKQQPLLSADRRAEREQELSQMQQDIQQSAATKDQEMSDRQAEMLSPLLEKVQTAIDEIAKQKGLALVMRAPALLYVDQTKVTDITEDIANKLGIPLDDGQTASSDSSGSTSN